MKNAQITIFYCHHQTERITPILKELDGSGLIDLKKIALPCSGKLEVLHATKALERGADGVAIFGCLEGKCRYIVGSQRARGRVRYTKRILSAIGIEEDRIHRFVLEDSIQQEGIEAFSTWVKNIQSQGSPFPNPSNL
ncbi:MAG: hydrogenase iron-sulfur subunit [Deltaproteobacteria bacterium]|nr:hydrogenase iron-sulfur subunit [Deltaproteobacteria bacterium]